MPIGDAVGYFFVVKKDLVQAIVFGVVVLVASLLIGLAMIPLSLAVQDNLVLAGFLGIVGLAIGFGLRFFVANGLARANPFQILVVMVVGFIVNFVLIMLLLVALFGFFGAPSPQSIIAPTMQ